MQSMVSAGGGGGDGKSADDAWPLEKACQTSELFETRRVAAKHKVTISYYFSSRLVLVPRSHSGFT